MDFKNDNEIYERFILGTILSVVLILIGPGLLYFVMPLFGQPDDPKMWKNLLLLLGAGCIAIGFGMAMPPHEDNGGP